MGMQSHVLMHPSLQVAKRKKRHAGYGQGMESGSLWYLQAFPVLSLWLGGGVKNSLPLNGLLVFWIVFLGLPFGLNAAYFASPHRDIRTRKMQGMRA